MIFLDTSAIYALADRGDSQHELAVKRFRAALESTRGFLTHNYVLVESMALIQHRLGLSAALKFAESARTFEIEWVDSNLHDEAARRLGQSRGRRVSFVDQVSFLVMRRHGVRRALAFDPDFAAGGFELYEG